MIVRPACLPAYLPACMIVPPASKSKTVILKICDFSGILFFIDTFFFFSEGIFGTLLKCIGGNRERDSSVSLPPWLPGCLPVSLPACMIVPLACLAAFLSACLLACQPACLPASLPNCQPACMIVRPACLPACLPALLHDCTSCLPACLPACLRACLPSRHKAHTTSWSSKSQ
jgi:hypothetical protein